MKRHCFIVGIVLTITAAIFCYSCMNDGQPDEGRPDKTTRTAFNPDIAGIGHNQCLDIFHGKLKQIKARRTRTEPDESIEDNTLEEALIKSLEECIENMEIAQEAKEDIRTEINALIEYCDKHPEDDTDAPEWSEHAINLADRLQTVIDTDYPDAVSAINDILAIETSAKQTLPEDECNRILTSTAIMRYSLEYWYKNHSEWFPVKTRSGSSWKKVAEADCDWALRAAGFGNIFPGARYAVLKWAMRGFRIVSWQAQALILTCVAAAGSLEEAISEDEDCISEEAYEELESDLSCRVAEKAIREFTESEGGAEEIEEGEEP